MILRMTKKTLMQDLVSMSESKILKMMKTRMTMKMKSLKRTMVNLTT